jgi:hypothetical protein
MALVSFKQGLRANLPSTYNTGAFYITTDERAIYLDIDSSHRIRLGDYQEFDSLTALSANTNPSTTALYYIKDINCLAKWNGTEYIQINPNDGITTIDFDGDGNVITGVTLSADGKKLTFTKGTSVKNGDNSITVGGTTTAPTVAVKISDKSDNVLTLDTESPGLYVPKTTVPEYSISKDSTPSEGFAATYHLTKDGSNIGTAINIPKDMVVESGSVVTNPTGQPAGTYLKLVLANADEDEIFINVASLIEYVTSGSSSSDMVVISISDDHKVTAIITDGAITKAKLDTSVQTALNQAHSHANKTELDLIASGDKAKWDAAANDSHTHSNKTVLDGITSTKVSAWDSAEQNAKTYAEGLLTWGTF